MTNNHLNRYSETPLTLPSPEFYMIYTGQKENHPDTISLGKEIFHNQDSPIDLTATVLYAKPEENHQDIISQYIRFCWIYDEGIHKFGRTTDAIEWILMKCRKDNIMQGYLSKEGVSQIMLSMFNQEEALRAYVYEEKLKSEQEGIRKGKIEGKIEGNVEGRKQSLLESIQSLMKHAGVSIEQAMDWLSVPQNSRQEYANLVLNSSANVQP